MLITRHFGKKTLTQIHSQVKNWTQSPRRSGDFAERRLSPYQEVVFICRRIMKTGLRPYLKKQPKFYEQEDWYNV